MPYQELTDTRIPVKIWSNIEDVEATAIAQLRNTASLPWTSGLAVMPDVHAGEGATIGSVVAMRDAVSPASVGVDIGCGMGAVRTSLSASNVPEDTHELLLAIERAIPVGFASHKEPAYPEAHPDTRRAAEELFAEFDGLTPEAAPFRERAERQLGTLGGGNHFIEFCLDECGAMWFMFHSGSRHIGLQLAAAHIKRAKQLPHNKGLPDPALSVFRSGTPEMDAYLRDLYWAQRYAMLNRTIMMERCQNVLREFAPRVWFNKPILCHHNYVAEETHFGERLFITRKGAIRAGRGEMGIIPGSMGARSYIVRGLGNPESYESASHGAGRCMSRTQAKKRFTVEDLIAQTRGIECRKEAGVVDEIPGAYKDIDTVMAHQVDLVEPMAALRQFLCVKGLNPNKKSRGKK